MTIKTQGPRRGLIGRWVMRFEASGQIISMAFQGTTAVSALTGVLAYTGYQKYVPYVLGTGILIGFVFAYIYVEWGLYNRKNREKQDRGMNFAKPQNLIDDYMIGSATTAGMKGRQLTDDERKAVWQEAQNGYRKLRNGVEIE